MAFKGLEAGAFHTRMYGNDWLHKNIRFEWELSKGFLLHIHFPKSQMIWRYKRAVAGQGPLQAQANPF